VTAGRILVIEDDVELGEELVGRLRRDGYEPTWIRDGEDALRADPTAFDLVLLDLGLPNVYGLDVLKSYRSRSEIPVLVLTARDHTSDKVRGLSLGADDYVTKPFWPDELMARIGARLRRPAMRRAEERADVVRAGTLEIDLGAPRVTVSGDEVELTRAELGILSILARRAGRAVARATLVEEALDEARGGGERTLDVHVSRLRKKLGDEGKRIVTVWGIGYRLELERGTER
jgi:two-component system response regulator MtrA